MVDHVFPDIATDDDSASTAVVHAVAEVARREPTDVDPLYQSVDPDGLDAVFSDTAAGAPRIHGDVSFPHFGYEVTVNADGSIVVSSPE